VVAKNPVSGQARAVKTCGNFPFVCDFISFAYPPNIAIALSASSIVKRCCRRVAGATLV